ncbi:alanine dehydrogenase [Pseudoclavibacter chungangensis]|uniref:Alanine dehydrogenase n=1 Tax=Pseudoclavibacter chungangensis TaxID=587635 RepID=A0A7J5C0R2_9MICO|nr:alanine dehydrogenase [Pseudoclavibacter chungangensis]KAB1662202.1 alanine dehydrogenase [Pseudoclavibacter chungangensis]NYJ65398.1 alanine dehydrogenase [Pseudoclavibacter chungangensis]
MRISVVKEIKPQEARVGLTPAGVHELVAHGHTVFVEAGAGDGAGFTDDRYVDAGAELADQATAWARAELLVKVKEPIESEYGFLRDDLTLFTYLHLAADRPLTEALLAAGTLAIAYETVQDQTGLPLLTPMSEIAGRLAAHAAAAHLMRPAGGQGVLIGGAPGVAPSRVLVIGGGAVGTQAALLALGMQAEVTILDTSAQRIRQLDGIFEGRARVLVSDALTLESEMRQADVIVGAVLVPGRAAPKVVRRAQLGLLKPDALLIDVAIDQGGAFETSHPTTYEEPTFEVDGIRHYCVANMPGAVPQTSTRALTNATLPYVLRLADLGPEAAIDADGAIAQGVNVRDGRIVHAGVAAAFDDLASTPV